MTVLSPRVRFLIGRVVSSSAVVAACGAFGGSDGDVKRETTDGGPQSDASSALVDDASSGSDASALVDSGSGVDAAHGCTTYTVSPSADSWFDCNPACNGTPPNSTHGGEMTVLIADNVAHPSESAIVRFDLATLPPDARKAVRPESKV